MTKQMSDRSSNSQ